MKEKSISYTWTVIHHIFGVVSLCLGSTIYTQITKFGQIRTKKSSFKSVLRIYIKYLYCMVKTVLNTKTIFQSSWQIMPKIYSYCKIG